MFIIIINLKPGLRGGGGELQCACMLHIEIITQYNSSVAELCKVLQCRVFICHGISGKPTAICTKG